MKFKLFDGDKKFHPSVLFWIFELRDDKGVIADQYFFLYTQRRNEVLERQRRADK